MVSPEGHVGSCMIDIYNSRRVTCPVEVALALFVRVLEKVRVQVSVGCKGGGVNEL